MNHGELLARVLKAAETFRDRGVTQAQVADALNASQSQVSRILSGHGLRQSRLQEEVCLYAERMQGGVTTEAVLANTELVEAIRMAWDGSHRHAKALSAVIRSLVVLRPGATESTTKVGT